MYSCQGNPTLTFLTELVTKTLRLGASTDIMSCHMEQKNLFK